jgi:hypothetical protein
MYNHMTNFKVLLETSFGLTLHFLDRILFVHVRQLEFSLLQLTQETDKLFNSIQSDIQRKLSIELVNTVVFQDILRNISLHLPETYKLQIHFHFTATLINI